MRTTSKNDIGPIVLIPIHQRKKTKIKKQKQWHQPPNIYCKITDYKYIQLKFKICSLGHLFLFQITNNYEINVVVK